MVPISAWGRLAYVTDKYPESLFFVHKASMEGTHPSTNANFYSHANESARV
jgi:hypothetical protein